MTRCRTISFLVIACALSANARAQITFSTLAEIPRNAGDGQGLTLGTDGALYGVNCGDSVENFGYVFRLDLTGVRTIVHQFDGLDGSCPNAELVAGRDGALYGTTYGPSRDAVGQILDYGIIFALHPERPEGQRVDILYRVAADGREGANLLGLVLGPDGNTLYGTALAAGPVGNGVLFQLSLTESSFSVLSAAGGSATPVVGRDGAVYWASTVGRYDPARDSLVQTGAIRCSYDGVERVYFVFPDPGDLGVFWNGVIQASDGNFYGTTLNGATAPYFGPGSLIRLAHPSAMPCASLSAPTFEVLHNFAGGPDDGSGSNGALFEAADGYLYGVTGGGGADGRGTIYRWNLDAAAYSVVWHFRQEDGAVPKGRLMQDAGGVFYGTTSEGTQQGHGTAFRFTTGVGHPTTTTAHPVRGVYGQQLSLSATLTGPDGPLAGRTIRFTFLGLTVGSAVTGPDGIASAAMLSFLEAGSYPTAVIARFDGEADYQRSAGSADATIAPATPQIVWPAPSPIIEGTPIDATQLNAAAVISGSFEYHPPAGTVLTAGAGQTLSVTFTPVDLRNYTTVTATVTIDVLPNADATPPVIAPIVNGTAGANGWYISPVHVEWMIEDPESSVSTQGCESAILTGETPGTTLTCRATSLGGTTEQSTTIRIDTTAPGVAIARPAATAYQLGQVIEADFTCADATSGIASCVGTTAAGSSIQTSSLGEHTFIVDVYDIAGNHQRASVTYLVTVGVPHLSTSTVDFGAQPVGTDSRAPTFATGRLPAAIAAGDFDNDGVLDIATANQLGDNASILLGNGDGTFRAAVHYPAGRWPTGIGLGDMDGNGTTDIAVANQLSHDVTLLLGNGDGSFRSGGTYPTAQGAWAAVVVDLDGDGNGDVAVANAGASTVTILGSNGDGTFQPARSYAASAHGLAAGDFNGDGFVDLATPATLLLGNGNGTFQMPRAFDGGDIGAAAGDFNGDGRLDIATASHGADRVWVLLGNGDGTFQTPRAISVPKHPFAVAAGDFNGDGHPDLAVPTELTANVAIVLGKGDGAFQPVVNYGFYPLPTGVGIGDFDRDSRADVVVPTSANRVAILRGKGDGSFRSSRNVILANTGTGALPLAGLRITGDHPDDFFLENTCGASLDPGLTCAIAVGFMPTAAGIRTAVLEIPDPINGTGLVSLLGNGVSDSDGDGVPDGSDAFPTDPTETSDADGDGVGDHTDAFPFDASETADTDHDLFGNNRDTCPLAFNPAQVDVDLDGVGDVCDVCPNDVTNQCHAPGSGSAEISAAIGGTVQTLDGNLQLEFDPGDLAKDATISVTQTLPEDPELNLPLAPGIGRALAIYDFAPDGLQFPSPVKLKVTAVVTSLNDRQRTWLNIYLWTDTDADGVQDTFVPVQGTSCVVAANTPGTFIATCTADITHFSVYALIAPSDTDSDGVPDRFEHLQDLCPAGPLVVTGLFAPLGSLVPSPGEAPLPDRAFKEGRTVPLKLRMTCAGVPWRSSELRPPSITGLERLGQAIPLMTIDPDPGEASDNGLLFRYDEEDWIYNLSTAGWPAGTYSITIESPEGVSFSARFVLR